MVVKSVENKEKSTAEVVVEVSAEEFETALNTAYKKNKGSIYVPGFRKGKAPRKIIERMYGASIFYEDAINIVCPDAYSFAVEDKALKAVGRPTVQDVDVNDDKVVTVTFLIGLYPEVVLGEYKGLSAPRAKVEISDAEVDADIEATRHRNARIETVDRAAQDGDTVNIDYEGFLNGTPFEGGKGEKHNLTLGSGQFVPGFEEQVVGMKAGEEKDISLTFPENYTEDLAGKDVVFHVKVNEVKENILPELDDEFAKDVSSFDTLAEYRQSRKDKLTEQEETAAKRDFDEALMNAAIANMTVEIPDAMLEEQLDNMIQDYQYRLASQGIRLEDYLQMMGMDMATFRTSSMPAAKKQVEVELLLNKIAEVEGLEVSDEELEAEHAKQAENYGMEADKLKNVLAADVLKRDMLLTKAADLIYSTGIATEPVEEKEEEKAEEKKPAAKKPAAKKTTAKKAAADDGEKAADGEEKPAAKKPAAKKTTKKAEDAE